MCATRPRILTAHPTRTEELTQTTFAFLWNERPLSHGQCALGGSGAGFH